MATVASKLITAEEFYDFVHRPENRDRVIELDRGEIVEMSRPGKRHGLICANIVRILGNFAAERKRGYVCSNDTGIIVSRDPDSVRGPDVMFFDDAASVEDIETTFAKEPPLVAIEVLSPNDSLGKLSRRVKDQLRFGVPLVWVLDPQACNVTVYRAGKEHLVVEAAEELSGEDLLPEFRCRVAEFFSLPGQS
jgi:Uma2 family endonuclease